jgi:hypothetical protein
MSIEQDHRISLAEASQFTANFRNANPPGTIIANALSKGIIQEILNQPGCEGIRIYNAIDGGGIATVVITGIDINNNDLYTGTLAEHCNRCPTDCPSPNPLNS